MEEAFRARNDDCRACYTPGSSGATACQTVTSVCEMLSHGGETDPEPFLNWASNSRSRLANEGIPLDSIHCAGFHRLFAVEGLGGCTLDIGDNFLITATGLAVLLESELGEDEIETDEVEVQHMDMDTMDPVDVNGNVITLVARLGEAPRGKRVAKAPAPQRMSRRVGKRVPRRVRRRARQSAAVSDVGQLPITVRQDVRAYASQLKVTDRKRRLSWTEIIRTAVKKLTKRGDWSPKFSDNESDYRIEKEGRYTYVVYVPFSKKFRESAKFGFGN